MAATNVVPPGEREWVGTFVVRPYVQYIRQHFPHFTSPIEVMCTKFQRCPLLNYFVAVDLVTSPKSQNYSVIATHSAYVIVIKMERFNKYQLRVWAVRLFEENYSYSATTKKVGRSEAWVCKWARRWKVESLQSQSRRRLTNKTTKNYSQTHKRLLQSHGWNTTLILHSTEVGLQIRQNCLRLKTFGALWLQSLMPA